MYQPQTFDLWISNDRVPYVVKKMSYCVEVIQSRESTEDTHIRVTISNPLELLCLFHAGIDYGKDFARGEVGK